MNKPVNSYNVTEKDNNTAIVYHIIAHDETEAIELLSNEVFNVDDYYIEVERYNVKTMTGEPFNVSIQSCLV